ncbi:Protein RUFY3 [Armadillidium vulgare]|nr:Protein RUFY3 [Armadillidium vulgare]
MVVEAMAGAEDTIYLCNFRVSVDGDWLCLKELAEGGINSSQDPGTTASNEDSSCVRHQRSSSISPPETPPSERDPVCIERSNLVNISKLVVKELIESSLKYGRMLDSDSVPLQHFFIVLEHVLRHGLKPKRGILGPKKELWDLFQMVEKWTYEAQDITASVRDLPTVNTHIGRARAWLRLALMQKKLPDYFRLLLEHRDDLLTDFYEPGSLMLSDEAIVIMGLLVGLNVIDCNLCVKEEDLDSQMGVIDFSLYLRTSVCEVNIPGPHPPESADMTTVLDQKNYIEELNRHLNATVTNLQAKSEALTTTNALMKEDLAIAKTTIMQLQDENERLRKLNGVKKANRISVIGCEEELEDLRRNLEEESAHRKQVERELELQIQMKAESEMAAKLLEKDIHEKQDTIISLRQQLEEIKDINLEMYKKLMECEMEIGEKGVIVSRLQEKTLNISKMLINLQQYSEAFKREETNEGCRENVSLH